MADELKESQKRIEVLEQKLSLYETDATMRGFYSLNRIVNQQIDYLNSFNLKTEISSNPKEDKAYDRAKGLWEGLKGLISDLNSLKSELKITGDEDKDKKRLPFNDRIAENRS